MQNSVKASRLSVVSTCFRCGLADLRCRTDKNAERSRINPYFLWANRNIVITMAKLIKMMKELCLRKTIKQKSRNGIYEHQHQTVHYISALTEQNRASLSKSAYSKKNVRQRSLIFWLLALGIFISEESKSDMQINSRTWLNNTPSSRVFCC